jgi:hypothetical protein
MDCSQLTTPQQGMDKAFCAMSEADLNQMAAMSGNNDGSESCPMMVEFQSFACHVCSDSCQTSPQFSSSANDDGADSEPNMAALCGDECVMGFIPLLKGFVAKEEQCVSEGKSTDMSMSGNDDDTVSTDDDNGGDPMAAFAMFDFGCVTNANGDNCGDMMIALNDYNPSDSTDPCADTQIQSLGCCFGSMIYTMSEHLSGDSEFEDAVAQVNTCPWSAEVMEPCAAGAVKDVDIIRSAMTIAFDYAR